MRAKSIFLLIFVLLMVFASVRASDYIITDCTDLQNMQIDPAGNYALASDIDCSDTINWNAGAGFLPIENFSGVLDGQGHKISNLFIYRPDESSIGLLSEHNYSPDSSVVKNLALVNVNITCNIYCGAIAGWNEGLITQSYATGSIKGVFTAHIGGLVGVNQGIVNNSWANVSLCGYYFKGGIISDNINLIENSYALPTFGDAGVCDNGNDRAGICAGAQGPGVAVGSYYAADVGGATRSWCGSPWTGDMASNSTEMQKKSTFKNWDFNNTWQICTRADPHSYPTLRVFGECCKASWLCQEFTACGQYHQDCLFVRDTNCGYVYDPALDGDMAQFGRNCSINAATPDISLQHFDLRYGGNLALFAMILFLWLACLVIYFFTKNMGVGGGAILLSIFLFILTFRQISWVFALLFPVISIMAIIFLNRED